MADEGGRRCRMYADPDGEVYVHVGDLAAWILGYAQHLRGDGQEDEANGAASVGIAFLEGLNEGEVADITVLSE